MIGKGYSGVLHDVIAQMVFSYRCTSVVSKAFTDHQTHERFLWPCSVLEIVSLSIMNVMKLCSLPFFSFEGGIVCSRQERLLSIDQHRSCYGRTK